MKLRSYKRRLMVEFGPKVDFSGPSCAAGRSIAASSDVTRLPPEILSRIFRYLDVADKGRVSQVCSGWRDVASVRSVWRGVKVKLYREWLPARLYPSLARRGIRRFRLCYIDLNVPGLLDLMRGIPNLEGLTFFNCKNVTDRKLSEAFSRRLTQLVKLRLTDARRLLDDSLGLVSRNCPNLVKLNLRSCKRLTDRGMLFVARGLLKLERLVLSDSLRISDVGIGYLAGCGLTETLPPFGAGLQSLRYVSLSGAAVTDVALRHLAGLPSLRELNMRNCPMITDAGLAHLARGGSQVERLDFSCCRGMEDGGMKHLAKMVTLRELKISYNFRITAAGLARLAEGGSRLERLDLTGCRGLEDGSMGHLAKMKTLRQLFLDDCPITDAGLAHLADGGSVIERLDLFCCAEVRDGGLGHLSRMAALRQLILNVCPVTDAGLALLVQGGSRIEHLTLYRCRGVTDVGLRHLAGMTTLRHLDLKPCSVRRYGKIRRILQSLVWT